MGKIVYCLLFLVLMLNSGCSKMFYDLNHFGSLISPVPDGVKITVSEKLEGGGVNVGIIGIKVVQVVIIDHKNKKSVQKLYNTQSFIVNKGCGFIFKFDCDSSLPCRSGLTGEEYLWGDLPWLDTGLVILPTKRYVAEIFPLSHLSEDLIRKIKVKERIQPLR